MNRLRYEFVPGEIPRRNPKEALGKWLPECSLWSEKSTRLGEGWCQNRQWEAGAIRWCRVRNWQNLVSDWKWPAFVIAVTFLGFGGAIATGIALIARVAAPSPRIRLAKTDGWQGVSDEESERQQRWS